MNRQEVSLLIDELKLVFDIVRLVDVTRTLECSIDSNGEITREPYECYAVWRKDRRCENCISSKAFAKKSQMAKYEFVDNEVYYVMSKYIEVDEEPYALEMVTKVTDETLFDAYGKNEFVDTITNLNNPVKRAWISPSSFYHLGIILMFFVFFAVTTISRKTLNNSNHISSSTF